MQMFYDVLYKEESKKNIVRFDSRDEAYTFANMKQLLQEEPVVIQLICTNDDFSDSYIAYSTIIGDIVNDTSSKE